MKSHNSTIFTPEHSIQSTTASRTFGPSVLELLQSEHTASNRNIPNDKIRENKTGGNKVAKIKDIKTNGNQIKNNTDTTSNSLLTNLKMLEKGKNITKEQLDLITTLSSSIAHELRTPLAIINLYTELLENNLKNSLADSNGDRENKLENKKTIENYLRTIKKVVKDTNYLIGNLLMQIKSIAKGSDSIINKKNFTRCSIAKSIEEVFTNYPFEENEKQLLKYEGNNTANFEYTGNKVLTDHILFNLVKNALSSIRHAEKGTITVRLETSGAYNKLIFIDTALGIAEEHLHKIFNQFESNATTQNQESEIGIGLGLAFCKMIMQSYSGDIICNSKQGEYTEFVLKFPRIL